MGAVMLVKGYPPHQQEALICDQHAPLVGRNTTSPFQTVFYLTSSTYFRLQSFGEVISNASASSVVRPLLCSDSHSKNIQTQATKSVGQLTELMLKAAKTRKSSCTFVHFVTFFVFNSPVADILTCVHV